MISFIITLTLEHARFLVLGSALSDCIIYYYVCFGLSSLITCLILEPRIHSACDPVLIVLVIVSSCSSRRNELQYT